jgi:FKBP-type peptidyl-prolyl cis-trans isomerase
LIELVDLQPPLSLTEPGNRMPLQVFDRRSGSMQEISCGDKVKAHITLWDLAGNPLLNTREGKGVPFAFILGQSSLPAGIEMGMLGMQADAARTLIVPPYLAQPLNPVYGPHPKDSTVQTSGVLNSVALPENQAILVDVELVP